MPERPSDSPRHLVTAMASTVGLDLGVAQRRGDLSADAVSDLVQRCRRCTAWQECPSWMNGHGLGAPQAPGYCLNRGRFDDIAQRARDAGRS